MNNEGSKSVTNRLVRFGCAVTLMAAISACGDMPHDDAGSSTTLASQAVTAGGGAGHGGAANFSIGGSDPAASPGVVPGDDPAGGTVAPGLDPGGAVVPPGPSDPPPVDEEFDPVAPASGALLQLGDEEVHQAVGARSTVALSQDDLRRQISVIPEEYQGHPDFGMRNPEDPEGAVELVHLRGPTTRVLLWPNDDVSVYQTVVPVYEFDGQHWVSPPPAITSIDGTLVVDTERFTGSLPDFFVAPSDLRYRSGHHLPVVPLGRFSIDIDHPDGRAEVPVLLERTLHSENYVAYEDEATGITAFLKVRDNMIGYDFYLREEARNLVPDDGSDLVFSQEVEVPAGYRVIRAPARDVDPIELEPGGEAEWHCDNLALVRSDDGEEVTDLIQITPPAIADSTYFDDPTTQLTPGTNCGEGVWHRTRLTASNTLILDLVVDSNWFLAPERVFPVIVDPYWIYTHEVEPFGTSLLYSSDNASNITQCQDGWTASNATTCIPTVCLLDSPCQRQNMNYACHRRTVTDGSRCGWFNLPSNSPPGPAPGPGHLSNGWHDHTVVCNASNCNNCVQNAGTCGGRLDGSRFSYSCGFLGLSTCWENRAYNNGERASHCNDVTNTPSGGHCTSCQRNEGSFGLWYDSVASNRTWNNVNQCNAQQRDGTTCVQNSNCRCRSTNWWGSCTGRHWCDPYVRSGCTQYAPRTCCQQARPRTCSVTDNCSCERGDTCMWQAFSSLQIAVNDSSPNFNYTGNQFHWNDNNPWTAGALMPQIYAAISWPTVSVWGRSEILSEASRWGPPFLRRPDGSEIGSSGDSMNACWASGCTDCRTSTTYCGRISGGLYSSDVNFACCYGSTALDTLYTFGRHHFPTPNLQATINALNTLAGENRDYAAVSMTTTVMTGPYENMLVFLEQDCSAASGCDFFGGSCTPGQFCSHACTGRSRLNYNLRHHVEQRVAARDLRCTRANNHDPGWPWNQQPFCNLYTHHYPELNRHVSEPWRRTSTAWSAPAHPSWGGLGAICTPGTNACHNSVRTEASCAGGEAGSTPGTACGIFRPTRSAGPFTLNGAIANARADRYVLHAQHPGNTTTGVEWDIRVCGTPTKIELGIWENGGVTTVARSVPDGACQRIVNSAVFPQGHYLLTIRPQSTTDNGTYSASIQYRQHANPFAGIPANRIVGLRRSLPATMDLTTVFNTGLRYFSDIWMNLTMHPSHASYGIPGITSPGFDYCEHIYKGTIYHSQAITSFGARGCWPHNNINATTVSPTFCTQNPNNTIASTTFVPYVEVIFAHRPPSDCGAIFDSMDFEGEALSTSAVTWRWDRLPFAAWYNLANHANGATLVENTASLGHDEVGLSENHCYRRRLFGGNESGVAPCYAVAQRATLTQQPTWVTTPTTHGHVSAAAAGGSSVDVAFFNPPRWNGPACDEATNQTAIQAQIRNCSSAAITSTVTETSLSGSGVTGVSLTGDGGEACVAVRARTRNKDGVWGPWSVWEEVTTVELNPPDMVYVCPTGTGQMDFEWLDNSSGEIAWRIEEVGVEHPPMQVCPSSDPAGTGDLVECTVGFLPTGDGNHIYTVRGAACSGDCGLGSPALGPFGGAVTGYTLVRAPSGGEMYQIPDYTTSSSMRIAVAGAPRDTDSTVTVCGNCSGSTGARIEWLNPATGTYELLTDGTRITDIDLDNPPATGSCANRGYGLRQWSPSAGHPVIWPSRTEGYFDIDGLESDTDYTFRMWYRNCAGCLSATYREFTFRTALDGPCCFDETRAGAGPPYVQQLAPGQYAPGAMDACVGECDKGTIEPDGAIYVCLAGPTFDPVERCDGLDNNCNGFIDEGYNLGESCGVCGEGSWACHPTDPYQAICVGASGNVLGESCSDDCEVWSCVGSSVQCVAEPDLGESCAGPCGTGAWICGADGSTLECEDPLVNECDGCGPLVGTIGDDCGDCPDGSTWQCAPTGSSEEGNVVCTGETEEMVCGVCYADVPGYPGDDCAVTGVGICSIGEFACVGSGSEGVECVPLFVADEEPEQCNNQDDSCSGVANDGSRVLDMVIDGYGSGGIGTLPGFAPNIEALELTGSTFDFDAECDWPAGTLDEDTCSAVRFSMRNTGSDPDGIPAEVLVSIWARPAGGTEADEILLSGPFELGSHLAQDAELTLTHCWVNSVPLGGAQLVVRVEDEPATPAWNPPCLDDQHALVGPVNLALCGPERCDGYDNSGSGQANDTDLICGNVQLDCIVVPQVSCTTEQQCIDQFGATGACNFDMQRCFMCTGTATEADGSCAPDTSCPGDFEEECQSDVDCDDGHVCLSGICLSSAWSGSGPGGDGAASDASAEESGDSLATADEPNSEDDVGGRDVSASEASADPDGQPGSGGCSAAPVGPPNTWLLLLLAFIGLRRRSEATLAQGETP